MQERVSWIKTNMTGGTMSALFNISNSYGALQDSMCTTIQPEAAKAAAACLVMVCRQQRCESLVRSALHSSLARSKEVLFKTP
jgi:hypothetical protein